MKLVRVIMAALGICGLALIAVPIVFGTPIGGVASLPFFDDDRAFRFVMLTPMLLPVVIILFVITTLVGTVTHSDTDASSSTVREPMGTTREHADPLDVLKQTYADGEISHEEYERRLRLLLDADSADDVRQRLERESADAERPRTDDLTEKTVDEMFADLREQDDRI